MSCFLRHLICISCVITHLINCELCTETRSEAKLRDFYSTRRNYLFATNVSCTINYFDVTVVDRMTLNVIHSREKLRSLDLSHNHISEILRDALEGLKMLETLRLTNNFILQLNSNHFGELPELTGLDLSSNLIHIVSVNAFAKLPSLLCLNVANNCLHNVALSLPLHALFSLNLAHNGIIQFPQLSGAINAITILNLSHNKISDLKIDFASTKALVKSIHTLDISSNQLKHPNQLLEFANLVELNLAGNEDINYGTNEKFVRHFGGMKKLNLTRTNLTSLDIFRHVDGTHFQELSLASNPLTTNFEELAKFFNLERLEFQQKSCDSFDSYRAIRRNFKSLKSVKILYDDNLNCKCIRWNKMQFEFETIEYLTDWSICDNEPDCGRRSMLIDDVIVMSLFVALIVIKFV